MKKRTQERISLAVVILCIWLSSMVLPNLDLNESLYQALKRGLGGIGGLPWAFGYFIKTNENAGKRPDPRSGGRWRSGRRTSAPK